MLFVRVMTLRNKFRKWELNTPPCPPFLSLSSEKPSCRTEWVGHDRCTVYPYLILRDSYEIRTICLLFSSRTSHSASRTRRLVNVRESPSNDPFVWFSRTLVTFPLRLLGCECFDIPNDMAGHVAFRCYFMRGLGFTKRTLQEQTGWACVDNFFIRVCSLMVLEVHLQVFNAFF